MNPNEQLIHDFYTAFQNGDANAMGECYHPEVQFSDPAFGLLKGKQASLMWRMLIERGKGDIKIVYSNVEANDDNGMAKWVAHYTFSQTNRRVVNHIWAKFQFKDGLIYTHTDDFDLWQWARQALGWKGFILGWTPFFQKKTQEKALYSLKKYTKNLY